MMKCTHVDGLRQTVNVHPDVSPIHSKKFTGHACVVSAGTVVRELSLLSILITSRRYNQEVQ